MRLDPAQFTGPSTSYHWNNGNAATHHSSSRLLPFHRLLRQETAQGISFFRFRASSVPRFARRSEILQRERDPADVIGSAYHRRFSSSVHRCSVEHGDGSETRNATAFRVSYDSVYRSGVRARIRTLTNILQKKSGECRVQRGNDRFNVENEEKEGDDGGGGNDDDGDDGDDEEDENDDGSSIEQHYTDDLVLSTSQESRSRSCYNGSRKPRTRWKNDDRDRANPFGESVNFSRICIANVTNVPSVDAFSYTAYNDENDIESCRDGKDESRAASSSEAGDARFGEDERRGEEEEEETKFRRVRRSRDEYEASQVVEGICGEEGERYRKFRDRGELNCWGGRGSRTRVKVRAASVNGGKRESHYTARFQRNPITNGSGENVTKLSTNGPTTTKVSSNNNNNNNNNNWCGRKYGLLFILYLLACPVVCSANPSGQFIPDFTHNPSLVQNLPRHNATQISSLLLSSSVAAHQRQQQQQQHQQYQQQRQHYRQMDEGEQRPREQLVRDVEQYGGKDGGHHRRRHEEQQQDDQAREQREVEESAYRDREAFLFETESTHPYNEYSWKVNQINPWLSACDLAGPAPADLQASCDPPEVPKNCPLPCVASSGGKGGDAEFFEVMKKVKVGGNCYWSNGEREEKAVESGRFGSSSIKSFGAEGSGEGASERKGRGDDGENGEGVRMVPEQCLFYLEESHKRNICRDDFGRASTLTPRENRYWFMSGLRLRHCCDHAVVNALAPGKGGPLENVLNGGQKCADALDKLLHVDTLAAKLHCGFEEVVARYDCAQPYSVIFNCTHCKEAYRKWVCSSLVPYFAHGEPQDLNSSNSWAGSRLRPCRSFCQSVEQRCPYLLPGDRAPSYPTQYAGEPTFLCRDPNIPETGEQAARALHSNEENECCFHACSEELAGSGICANCTNQVLRRRGKNYDPPTAPYCEVNCTQPASTGGGYQDPGSTDSGAKEEERCPSMNPVSVTNTMRLKGTLVCGTGGGVDSIASVSSSNRSAASILPQLFWLCSILTSILGNVRTIPVLWISKIFLWSIMPLAGVRSDECDGGGGDGGVGDRGLDGGSNKNRSELTNFLAWLRRCFHSRVDYHVSVLRYVANWLHGKCVVVEHRRRSWWCCCWCWWWWRWWRKILGRARWKCRRARHRSRENIRYGQFAGTRPPPPPPVTVSTASTRVIAPATSTAIATSTATTTAAATAITTSAIALAGCHVGSFSRSVKMYRDSYHDRSPMWIRNWPPNFLVDSFTVKCPWRRWSWWWWWLYRWWRRGRAEASRERKNRPRVALRHDRRRGRRGRRRGGRRREGGIRVLNEVFEEDVRSSPTRRRYFKLSSRKDPP